MVAPWILVPIVQVRILIPQQNNVGLGEWFIHQSAKLTTSVRIRYPTLNPGAYRQYGSGKEVLLCFLPGLKCPCSVMDSTPDYGSVSEGSSPSRDTKVCYI